MEQFNNESFQYKGLEEMNNKGSNKASNTVTFISNYDIARLDVKKELELIIYYIFELEKTEITEIGDSNAGGFDGDDDLNQLHRLRPHQIHRRATPPASVTSITVATHLRWKKLATSMILRRDAD